MYRSWTKMNQNCTIDIMISKKSELNIMNALSRVMHKTDLVAKLLLLLTSHWITKINHSSEDMKINNRLLQFASNSFNCYITISFWQPLKFPHSKKIF